MEISYFLPEFYACEHNERHDELKNELLPIIEEKTLENRWELSNCKSSYSWYDNSFLIHPILTEMISGLLDKILVSPLIKNSHGNLQLKATKFHSVWCNTYEPGGYQEIHNHNGIPVVYGENIYYNTYSFIYVLHSESTTGTVFRSRNPSFDASTNTYSVPCNKEGTLIMFPYYMDHYVLPTTGKRTTITGNIVSILG